MLSVSHSLTPVERSFRIRRGCLSKKRYSTYESAASLQRLYQGAVEIRCEDDTIFRPYACDYCGGYHLGHSWEFSTAAE